MRLWSRLPKKLREGLSGFALVFALTMFVLGVQSAYEGIVKRNRDFDKYRWWYPICSYLDPARCPGP